MGKGDPKTKKGKIWKGTYGKHRSKKKQKEKKYERKSKKKGERKEEH